MSRGVQKNTPCCLTISSWPRHSNKKKIRQEKKKKSAKQQGVLVQYTLNMLPLQILVFAGSWISMLDARDTDTLVLEPYGQHKNLTVALKGQSHEIFDLDFFHESIPFGH
jgi:hypothetical protein